MRAHGAVGQRGSRRVAGDALRAAGLRATPQRIGVLDILQRVEGAHLSADDVWQRLQAAGGGMERSTVYRVLSQLTEAGLLEQVPLGDGVARFEIQEVAHHHAVCTRCGATEDVGIEVVRALAVRMRRETGFVLGHHPLLLPGLCAACAAARD